ncbi:MAG: hypothetical protein JO309_13575, partial [Pseudonocardiales bacterium]|nr:hypothetical protein [Pseudonocardiales bacterium]
MSWVTTARVRAASHPDRSRGGESIKLLVSKLNSTAIVQPRLIVVLRESGWREDAMSVTVTLPASPGPFLETGLLPGDFYAYEELLSEREREQVERMREFLRRQVAPIVDDYWA